MGGWHSRACQLGWLSAVSLALSACPTLLEDDFSRSDGTNTIQGAGAAAGLGGSEVGGTAGGSGGTGAMSGSSGGTGAMSGSSGGTTGGSGGATAGSGGTGGGVVSGAAGAATTAGVAGLAGSAGVAGSAGGPAGSAGTGGTVADCSPISDHADWDLCDSGADYCTASFTTALVAPRFAPRSGWTAPKSGTTNQTRAQSGLNGRS